MCFDYRPSFFFCRDAGIGLFRHKQRHKLALATKTPAAQQRALSEPSCRPNNPRLFHPAVVRAFFLPCAVRQGVVRAFSLTFAVLAVVFSTGGHCGAAAGGLWGEGLGDPAGALPKGGGAEFLPVQGR